MNTKLVPVFAGELSGVPAQLVDARLLHGFLEVGRMFAHWIKERIEEYGFQPDQDYLEVIAKTGKNSKGGRPSVEYHITLDMAKELAMVERNEKGREVRRYFIECERRLRDAPPYAIKDLRSKKALPGGLSLAQQDAIKELVKARVEALPAEKRGGAAITLWSSLKTHFGCTYKLIPPDQFTDALSLIARVELGEAMPIPRRIETPRHAHYAHAREQHASLMSWGKRALPPRVQEEFYLAMKELEGALITGWTEMDEACMHLAIANAMLKRWKNGR